jgi:hypothetical protein
MTTMRFIRIWWYAVLMLVTAVGLCRGQVTVPATPSTPSAAVAPAPEGPPDKKDTLRALLQTRDGIRTAMDEQRKKLQTVTGDSAKLEVQQQIELLDKRRQEVERDFTVLVTGMQSNQASGSPTQKVAPLSIQEEMSQLLTPIFADLRTLTQKSRAFQELEEELIRLREREVQEKRAVAEIDKLLAEVKAAKTPDTTLRSALNDSRKAFQGRLDEVTSRSAAVQHQLGELKITGASFWKDLGLQLKRFVFIRGTNILLALFVFMVVFFGLRTAYSYFMKVIALRKYQRLSFMLRVLDVAHEGGSFLLALLAALLVLYARGDWLLGGLSLLALGGLLMTAKAGITRHLEQLQFLLNLGQVREGERVIIAGVAWRVGTIYMFTQLTNPAMPGAVLRLPLQTLAAMTSRPSRLGEPWFPCEIGSWILLAGTTLAQVKNITPENVVITYQGGLERWIPMATFLTLDTASLSAGFSRTVMVDLPVGHDSFEPEAFIHQLTQDIRECLQRMMRPEELRDLKVALLETKGASNTYEVTGHFASTQAPQYTSLPAMIRHAALEAMHQS